MLTHQGLTPVQPDHSRVRVTKVLMHFRDCMCELKSTFDVARMALLPSRLQLLKAVLLCRMFANQRQMGPRRNVLRGKFQTGPVSFFRPFEVANELQRRTEIEKIDRVMRRSARGEPVKSDRLLMPIQRTQHCGDRRERETVPWL